MKYTLGVDIALRKSGLALLDGDDKLVYHDIITVPAKVDYTEAVLEIYEKVTAAYTFIENKFSPENLTTVMEDVAGFVHIKAALAIHAARTAAVLAYHHSHTSNRSIVYYTPNAVKYWLANKRGAKKEELQSAIASRFPQYNYASLGEDEIDALALVLYHTKGVQSTDANVVSGTKRRRVPKRA